jgi:hypothetical protein
VAGGGRAKGLQGAMRGSKDTVLAFALRTLLNSRLSAIGRITELSVDTAQRRARLRMALRGERGAIDAADLRYDLHRANGGDWLTLVDAASSREWLTAAVQQFAVGRPFPIPASAARALRLLA